MAATNGTATKSGVVSTKGGAAPIVIGYRKITKRPVYKRIRSFVGLKRMVLNVAIKTLDLFEELCFESGNEVIDEGESQVVYWAIEVDEPWGVNPVSELQARRVPEKPGCGAYYEVIRIIEPGAEKAEGMKQAENSRVSNPIPPQVMQTIRRPEQDKIRDRMRAQLLKDGHFDPEAGMPPE